MGSLGTRSLVLSIGGQDVTAECTSAKITSSKSDMATFANPDARAYVLEATFVQATSPWVSGAPFAWDEMWTAVGTTVAYVLKPEGAAATATTVKPWLTGNLVITEPDTLIGGDLDQSLSKRWTFDVKWECTGRPTRVTS